jgi:hypothetical protein
LPIFSPEVYTESLCGLSELRRKCRHRFIRPIPALHFAEHPEHLFLQVRHSNAQCRSTDGIPLLPARHRRIGPDSGIEVLLSVKQVTAGYAKIRNFAIYKTGRRHSEQEKPTAFDAGQPPTGTKPL